MKNPTSLTREQNLQNWSKIFSDCQSAKARVPRYVIGLKLIIFHMIITIIGMQESETLL